ncbi:hypothetical protein PG995_010628 [Apiospora arundinis]
MPATTSKPRKLKVKSGCRTCKIRKVKCDEGRPACERCLSTGRVCDGYGVWGGGGNSAAEQDCFEWFSCKASTKLQGIFCITFWSQLLPQACINEPAIMHAVLALSSTHQKNVIRVGEPSSCSVLDKSDEFALVQYSKAIQQLRPHLTSKTSSAASIRVALIAWYSPDAENVEPILVLKPTRDFVDEWIADTLTKLLVQANLHGARDMPYPRLVMRITSAPLPSLTFHSVTEARQHLDQLVNDILYLAEDSRRLSSVNKKDSREKLARRQSKILTGLHTWHRTYKASQTIMKSTLSPFTHYGYLILLSMYYLAQIMVSVSLVDDEDEAENIYDAHTPHFLAIVRHSSELRRLIRFEVHYNPLVQYTSKISQSTADMGWIPPLYYTALKCRVRRVRLHALRFLGFKPHKEGIWDTEVTSAVAREVIRLEEGDGDDVVKMKDPDVAVEVPTEEEVLAMPTVPVARRLHDFQLRLPDDVAGKIGITYRQGPRSSGAPLCVREYDLAKRAWEDSWREERGWETMMQI